MLIRVLMFRIKRLICKSRSDNTFHNTFCVNFVFHFFVYCMIDFEFCDNGRMMSVSS